MDYRMLWRAGRSSFQGRRMRRLDHDRRRSALHECVTREGGRTLLGNRPLGTTPRPFADRARGADDRNMIDNPDPL